MRYRVVCRGLWETGAFEKRARNKDEVGSKRVLTDGGEEVKVFVSARGKSALFFVPLRYGAFEA
jgi:hypothetical protein